MAKEFLNQLLKFENRLESGNGQHCMICLEECGSLSSETGIIECLIRLPCSDSHVVGSHCIATWLRDNNTCPVCRTAFFPAQSRPYLEHGIIQDDGDDDEASNDDTEDDCDEDDNDQDRLDRFERNAEWASHQLELNYAASQLSQLIARRVFHMGALGDCGRWSKVAVCVYIASHLVRHHLSTQQISTVIQVTPRRVHDTYRLFYPERETVIDRECLFLLREDPQRATTGDLPPLNWPRPEYTNAIWEMIAMRFQVAPQTDLISVSRGLFQILVDKTYFGADSVMSIVALSVYLASWLEDVPIPYEDIALATSVRERDISTIYALFYPHREDLLEYRAAGGNNSVESLLSSLPLEVPPRVEW